MTSLTNFECWHEQESTSVPKMIGNKLQENIKKLEVISLCPLVIVLYVYSCYHVCSELFRFWTHFGYPLVIPYFHISSKIHMNVKDPVRNILLKLEGINMFLCASCRALIFDLQIWLMALSPSHQWRKSCCEPQRTRRAHHSNGRHGRYFFSSSCKVLILMFVWEG
jgi:hypothetical protein